jgi:hypothetical protein
MFRAWNRVDEMSAEKYLRHAAECIELAETTHGETKKTLLAMAATWRQLAQAAIDKAEKRGPKSR